LVEIDGLIGQYGSESVTMYDVHAKHAQSINWQKPSATRGRFKPRAIADPRLLPIPRPTRNTARIIENVYVVAPKMSERFRVQITSAASAVRPDNAVTR